MLDNSLTGLLDLLDSLSVTQVLVEHTEERDAQFGFHASALL